MRVYIKEITLQGHRCTALSGFLPPKRPKQRTSHTFFNCCSSFAQAYEKIKQIMDVSMNVLSVKLLNYWFLWMNLESQYMYIHGKIRYLLQKLNTNFWTEFCFLPLITPTLLLLLSYFISLLHSCTLLPSLLPPAPSLVFLLPPALFPTHTPSFPLCFSSLHRSSFPPSHLAVFPFPDSPFLPSFFNLSLSLSPFPCLTPSYLSKVSHFLASSSCFSSVSLSLAFLLSC